MKRSYLIGLVILIAVVVAAYFLYQSTRREQVAADLIVLFADDTRVEKRSNPLPREAAYQVGQHTIKGETRPGIFMHPTARLTYRRVLIPESGHLKVFLAVKEEAWDKPCDGVLFRFGVSDGREYQELINQHVNPVHDPSDRQWIEKDVNLASYAGQQVDLIFNTNTSLPGQGDNGAYDYAVWGQPQIVVKQ
jgi:hypothetical protein